MFKPPFKTSLKTTFRSYSTPMALALSVVATPLWAAPRVVADIAPIHGLAARVMDGVATPDLLVDPGASPHDYAMRPSDAGALSAADLVIWMGADLTPGLEKPMETLAGQAQKLTLLALPETQTYEMRDTVSLRGDDHDDHDGHDDHAEKHGDKHGHDDDHGDEHGHDDAHGDEHGHDDAHGDEHADDHGEKAHDDHADEHAEEHHHDGLDPHAWLAPDNAKAWLTVIADSLAEIDPENGPTYRANATAGQAEIDATVAEITALLAPFAGTPYVVFHDAYQYFERPFGLAPVGAISLGDASDPSPARIAQLRDVVADAGATCVFSEPQFNAGLINAVFDGSTARTAVIDPLGTTIEPGPDFYPTLLRDLARAISGCL